MNLSAIMQIVSSLNLDQDTRQKLLRAARGESDEETNEAIEAVIRALGIVDEEGNVKKEEVEALMENIGLDVQPD